MQSLSSSQPIEVQVIESDLTQIIDSFLPPEPTPYTQQIFDRAQLQLRMTQIQQQQHKNPLSSTNAEDDEQIELLFTNLDTGQSSKLSLKEVEEVNDLCFSKNKEITVRKNRGKDIQKGGAWYEFWRKVSLFNLSLRQAAQQNNHSYLTTLFSSPSTQYPLDINSRGFDDWTALHYASYQNHFDIVQLLLKNNADVNAETRFGGTALHIGCIRGNLEAVKILVEKGVDVEWKDGEGRTGLGIAVGSGEKEIVEVLLGEGKARGLGRWEEGVVSEQIRKVLRKYEIEVAREGVSQLGSEISSSPIRKQRKPSTNPSPLRSLHSPLTPESFSYHKLLGTGSFGRVFLVSLKSTSINYKLQKPVLFALKVLKKQLLFSRNLTKYAYAQRNVLSSTSHPFIVTLHSSFQTPTKLFLLLDYCPGGDLGKLLLKRKRLPESQTRLYIAQLTLALQALHKNMVVYRDLKPDNVVLDSDGHVKLTDFGLSKQGVHNNITDSFCGSIAYLAPQILNKQGHTRMVDWYLLGVLTYELLTGLPPYYSTERQQLYKNIKEGSLKMPRGVSDVARDFILKLLKRDPKGRLGYDREASQVKEHGFFEGLDWEKVMKREQKMPKVEMGKVDLKETMKVDFNGGKKEERERLDRWTYINDM